MPCHCWQEGTEQAHDANEPAPKCYWPEMKTEYLTVAILTFTFGAILWQAVVYQQMRDHTRQIERAYVALGDPMARGGIVQCQ